MKAFFRSIIDNIIASVTRNFVTSVLICFLGLHVVVNISDIVTGSATTVTYLQLLVMYALIIELGKFNTLLLTNFASVVLYSVAIVSFVATIMPKSAWNSSDWPWIAFLFCTLTFLLRTIAVSRQANEDMMQLFNQFSTPDVVHFEPNYNEDKVTT